jgi:hypothetical protein
MGYPHGRIVLYARPSSLRIGKEKLDQYSAVAPQKQKNFLKNLREMPIPLKCRTKPGERRLRSETFPFSEIPA